MGKIGFMQGRLSPLIDGKIQCFPWPYWENEFMEAEKCQFSLMEWTLDHDRLYENPLMNQSGRAKVKALMNSHKIEIKSLTGDCFMHAPFYKREGREREALITDLKNIIEACGEIGIQTVLIPLVDDGRLENDEQENNLKKELAEIKPLLSKSRVKISFESDYQPSRLAKFMADFEPKYFGITYDIGNSASLGYDHGEEIEAYGCHIINVHIKDRIRGGTTVPLGKGDADIPGALAALRESGYRGNFILQTARAENGAHAELLSGYRDLVEKWL